MEKELQKKQMEDVYNIIHDVLKNWWVILCIAISASFLTYIGSSILYHPTYTSSTTFVVSAKGSSTGAYANQSKTQKLTDTFQSVMDSQILKKKVAESLEMDTFPGTVEIAVVPETNLLTVSVTSDSSDISFKLLDSMLENYQEVSKNVLGEVVLEVFEEPNFPSAPNESFHGKDMMKKGFLAGALVMVVLLGVMSYLKDSVKSEDDVEEKLDTTLFGVLSHEPTYRNLKARIKRQKKRMLITELAVSFRFVETVKKMRTKLLYKSGKDGCKVLLVTSTAKNEGKTTVAANLALAMAQRGKNILLIEGDLRKTGLAEFLGVAVPKGAGLGENLVSQGDLENMVFQMEGTTLHLLVNSVAHPRSTEFLASKKFEDFLKAMKSKMDFVIIDGPAAKGRADAEVLARKADCSLLVVKQNFSKVPYINDMIDMLNSYGNGVAGCVFNDVFTGGSVISSGYGYGYGYGYGRYRYGKYYGYGKYQSYYYNRRDRAEKTEKAAADKAVAGKTDRTTVGKAVAENKEE